MLLPRSVAHELSTPSKGRNERADAVWVLGLWWTAFAFAYVERLLKESPAAAKTALDKVESLLPLLDQANYAKDM